MKPRQAILAGVLLLSVYATMVAVAQVTLQIISIVKIDVLSLDSSGKRPAGLAQGLGFSS